MRKERRVMKINEVLTELFQPKQNWEWGFTGSEEVEANFVVGEVPYKFYAFTTPDTPGVWEVEFSVNRSNRASRNHKTRYGLTGTGNAAEVMSTVVDIMREFLQRYQGNITTLVFTAEEASRKALYARMISRLLPTWDISTSPMGNEKQFVVTKPQA